MRQGTHQVLMGIKEWRRCVADNVLYRQVYAATAPIAPIRGSLGGHVPYPAEAEYNCQLLLHRTSGACCVSHTHNVAMQCEPHIRLYP